MKKIIKKIKAFLQNDIVERCYKTFIEAFIGTLITVNVADITNIDYVKTLVLSAIIAGISAVWNIIKSLIDKKLNTK